MSDCDSIVRAIALHPEEETPRLHLADWLQEYGDYELGHYIRLCNEWTRAGKEERERISQERAVLMPVLEQRLEHALRGAWAAEHPNEPMPGEISVRSDIKTGAITVSWSMARCGLAIRINRERADDKGLGVLDLYGSPETNLHLASFLRRLELPANIINLEITDQYSPELVKLLPEALQNSPLCRNITSLIINHITDYHTEDVVKLANLPAFTNLTSLYLDHVRQGENPPPYVDQAYAIFDRAAQDKGLGKLKRLVLLAGTSRSIDALARCAEVQLVSLDLVGLNRHNPAKITALSKCRNLAGLQRLDLRRNGLVSGDMAGIAALSECQFGSLQELNLSDNYCDTAPAVPLLQALSRCDNLVTLQRLDLSKNDLVQRPPGYDGWLTVPAAHSRPLAHLKDCKNLCNLTHLSLASNGLFYPHATNLYDEKGCPMWDTASHGEDLAACTQFTHLRVLDLSENRYRWGSWQDEFRKMDEQKIVECLQPFADAIRRGQFPALEKVHLDYGWHAQSLIDAAIADWRKSQEKKPAAEKPAADWASRTSPGPDWYTMSLMR